MARNFLQIRLGKKEQAMSSNANTHFKNFPSLPCLREIPSQKTYGAGDVMVVFGEIFSRGYANGILDEAQKAGMKVIRSTVGRRNLENQLRNLTPEELETQPKDFINIALEAGFDLEKSSKGNTPCDQLAGFKMGDWDKVSLDWEQIEDSRARADKRFKAQVGLYLSELKKCLPKGKNVLFVHTMAGGVPRAKLLMPTMNKIFKGQGDRHIPSKKFWESDIGKLCAINFTDVTAGTFNVLINATADLRAEIESAGGHTSYVAYGYHGTEALIQNEFKWQTYSPYVQGWAKMKLEDHSFEANKKGVRSCVYNCPEILTNSSSIFSGVEVSLYPLLGALQNEVKANPQATYAKGVLAKCQNLLKDEFKISDVLEFCESYLTAKVIREHCDYQLWPQHSSQEQMEKMLQASAHLWSMHKSEKDLITFVLSEEVFKATGYLMFYDSWSPKSPVSWLNHDVIAKLIAKRSL